MGSFSDVLRFCFTKDTKGVFSLKENPRNPKMGLCFFTIQINPSLLGSWCVKGTAESTSTVDSAVLLMHHDPKYLGLNCLA